MVHHRPLLIGLLSLILMIAIWGAGALFNLAIRLLGLIGVGLIRLVGWIVYGIRMLIDRIRYGRA